jgi:DNA topoisomerase-1
MSKLVIVESPTKAKTISQFLGKEYRVESSYGHVRDLPKSRLGIDVEKNFEPSYVIPTKNRKRVNLLKKEAGKADEVILATDEDREGEAIAWHLTQALGLDDKKTERIAFHEITEKAIKEALSSPRPLNLNLVDAQQARRVLDRLVGYKLSPFLWKKVARGLSAGRVQSAALRLIVEREEEIKKFIPEIYFSVSAELKKTNSDIFSAILSAINGEKIKSPGIKDEKTADVALADLNRSALAIKNVETKEIRRSPFPPFTTSSLQQESSKRLRFSAKQTMRLAQGLYENGLITYMRTDSVNLSQESVVAAKKWLVENLGERYAVEAPRFFKTKSRLAQEAHEAIRPTNPSLLPKDYSGDEKTKKLYELIWQRFIASQCPKAIFNSVRLEIEAEAEKNIYTLSANGLTLQFDGFLKIWPGKFEENELPPFENNEKLELIKAEKGEHQTEPPARYNEASLIKTLEEFGIGRPSTYAPTISVIQDRNYVEKNEARRFQPTEIGALVSNMLVEHFPKIVDIKFTAEMEEKLDSIAEGKEDWHKTIKDFYVPFSAELETKYAEVEKQQPEEKTSEVCEKCGRPMVVKFGRFGKFLSCSGFPECKNAKKLIGDAALKNEKGEELKCPECKEGLIVRKKTRKGRFFYGCSRYPECKYASWKKPE